MIAFQDKADTTIYDTIKTVVSGCTYDAIDVDKLALVDLEYIFLNLRIKSKGSVVDVAFKCDHDKEDGSKCGHVNEIQIDLNEVTVDSKTSNNISLEDSEKFGVILKYPTLSSIQFIETLYESNNITQVYSVFSKFIDTIYKGDDLFDTKDYTEEDLVDWIESLTDSQFSKIKKFFEDLPRLRYKKLVKCSSCGHEETIEMVGLKSFLE